MIHDINIENIESFNDKRALNNLAINILVANKSKFRAEQIDNNIVFYNKNKQEVYRLDINDASEEELEALSVAFNSKCKETKYDIRFTCKPGEYVYVLLPTKITDNNEGFTFKTSDITYAKVNRLYGSDKVYTLSDLRESKELGRELCGIPNIFCFKNVCEAITVCRITPEDGYKSIDEYFENCEKYIRYEYKADFGYDYKSVIPYEYLVDYDIDGSTFTYEIFFDTDEECSHTYTLPIAINEATDKIIKNITKCRADSLGKDGINISLNGESIKIKRVRVNVAFSIDDINSDKN